LDFGDSEELRVRLDQREEPRWDVNVSVKRPLEANDARSNRLHGAERAEAERRRDAMGRQGE